MYKNLYVIEVLTTAVCPLVKTFSTCQHCPLNTKISSEEKTKEEVIPRVQLFNTVRFRTNRTSPVSYLSPDSRPILLIFSLILRKFS